MSHLSGLAPELLFRHQRRLIFSVALGIIISMVAYHLSAKLYKVQTTISIQTQYFQVPLVQDFVPITYDEAELRSQRESLVRWSLDQAYLRDLGIRYGLFKTNKQSEVSSYDADQLARKFEIINVNPMTFLLGFSGTDPEVGYQIIQDFIAHLRKNLESGRHRMLSQLRDAIKDQLEILAFGGSSSGSGIMSSRPDLVKDEIARVGQELHQLRSVYSDKHPRVLELEHNLAKLSQYLKPQDLEKTIQDEHFSGAKLDPAAQELFRDLLKKFHYISVVMYMDQRNQDGYLILLQEPFIPRQPVWPKLPLHFAWGVALGLLGGSLWAFALEARSVKRAQKRDQDSPIVVTPPPFTFPSAEALQSAVP